MLSASFTFSSTFFLFSFSFSFSNVWLVGPTPGRKYPLLLRFVLVPWLKKDTAIRH